MKAFLLSCAALLSGLASANPSLTIYNRSNFVMYCMYATMDNGSVTARTQYQIDNGSQLSLGGVDYIQCGHGGGNEWTNPAAQFVFACTSNINPLFSANYPAVCQQAGGIMRHFYVVPNVPHYDFVVNPF